MFHYGLMLCPARSSPPVVIGTDVSPLVVCHITQSKDIDSQSWLIIGSETRGELTLKVCLGN